MTLNTKGLLMGFCKYVYYTGAGNHWHEDIYHETLLYRIYSVISIFIYTTMTVLENMSAMFGDVPDVDKYSAYMFVAVHDILLAKIFLFLYHKASIRKLNYEMATVGEEFEEEHVMQKQLWKVKWFTLSYVIMVYVSLVAYGVDSIRRVIVEGALFYTVVTYFPRYTDVSITAAAIRIFFYITWLYMMLPMISADCMPTTHLITTSYKFLTLCNHYKRIREEFDSDLSVMTRKEAVEKLKAACLEGIRMHQKLIILADEINRIFGMMMSLQVCESSVGGILLLLRLALSPHLEFTNAVMTYTFICALFISLALNLWNAGEITYQASLLSHAMFFCGWHLSEIEKESHKDIRQLVLVGCAQAQKPLVLKAFGVQNLSYETFVSVARMTYSIFAVFYQRRE